MKLAILPLFLCLTAYGQTTWYVDASGSAPGQGTLAAPYTSIQFALSRPTTKSGDRVLVAPGTYVEQVNFGFKRVSLESAAGPLATEIRAPAGGATVDARYFGSGGPSSVVGFTIRGTPGVPSTGVLTAVTLVRRCVIAGHEDSSSGQFGVGVTASGTTYIEECTIAANADGVTVAPFSAMVYVRNTILAGNENDLLVDPETLDVRYSLVEEPSVGVPPEGPGNLLADPLFWEREAGDYALAPGSPAINAGDPASPLDPDGSRIEIGALPFDGSYAPAPVVYCTAKANSLGCLPRISSIGRASGSGAPFTILCADQLNQRSGLLFYGHAPLAKPYQGGYLCVRSPFRRSGLLQSGGSATGSDCSGVFSFDFGSWIASGADPSLVPGSMVYTQFWSRDAQVSFATVRSDALRFGIAP
jgi:hypothetical protein